MVLNNDEFRYARKSIKDLFTYLKIERVICVDDQYDNIPTLEKFRDLYSNLRMINQLPSSLQSITSGDFELEDIEIEKFWKQLSSSEQKALLREMRKAPNQENDIEFANILKNLLQAHNLQELSLSAWRKRKPELMEEAKGHKTLFLFDQDFRGEGGSSEEGFNLIEDLLTVSESESISIHCGLLSHTFQVEKEQVQLNQYAEDHPDLRDNFIFISKSQLLNDPQEFAKRIKMTVISPMCKALKETSAEVIKQAHENAVKRVDLIDIYDFEHIVFQSSSTEGVWEPDTLFRLFGIYHKHEARELAKQSNDLHSISANIRPFSSISMHSKIAPKSRAWEVRQLELYEKEEYVNGLHMPIELGDIFKITEEDSIKNYILLAQPCDLMIRKNGKRKQSIHEVTLAEIIPLGSPDLGSRDTNGYPVTVEAFHELPYFDGNGKSHFVSFQRRHSVNLYILDLCAYQEDGSAKLTMISECPAQLIPTWQKHYEELVGFMKPLIAQYQEIYESCQEMAEDNRTKILSLARASLLMLPTLSSTNSNKNLFAGDINFSEQSVTYTLKRSGRLSQTYSTALLAKFAAFLARTAFEHDFGSEKN